MQSKKKMPRFYTALIICWIAALVLLGIALLIVRSYLADYESVQPKYVAEQVFSEYFENRSFERVLAESKEKKNLYESNETVAEHLKALTNGKELTYHNISSGLDLDASKYIVKYSEGDEDVKIASFTLTKNGKKSSKGFEKYSLSDMELFYTRDNEVTLKVLKGSIPYVNGIPLTEDLIAEDNITHESSSHLPEGVSGILYTLYKLDGLVSEPDVKVTDSEGTELSLTYDSDGGFYVTELVYDKALEAEMSDRVIEAAKMFATYMQNDCTLTKLNPYFEKGTALYNSIKSTLQWAVIDHDSYDFEDIKASEFYRYDENTFSCRVKMTHVLKRKRLEDYRDTMNAVFYLRNIDGAYMVYDRTNN